MSQQTQAGIEPASIGSGIRRSSAELLGQAIQAGLEPATWSSEGDELFVSLPKRGGRDRRRCLTATEREGWL